MSVLALAFLTFSGVMWIAGVNAIVREKGCDGVLWSLSALLFGPFTMFCALLVPSRLRDMSRYD